MNPTIGDVKTTLVEARAFVEKGWTQMHLARRKDGSACSVIDESAREWCMGGALQAAAHKLFSLQDHPAFTGARTIIDRTLLGVLPKGNRVALSDWNDVPGRKQKEVLAIFDKAIEMAKEEEATWTRLSIARF